MRIVQAVFGVFHHFELARELDRRGHLDRVYSTWPWQRLQREGLPHSKVETFPWVHMLEYGAARLNFSRIADHLGYANALAFDRWTQARLPPCDALIAISGAGLRTGRLVQERGGRFLCDRGSTHQRYQEQVVSEEFRRWGVDHAVSDIRDTLREEAIYAQADAITVPSTIAARSFETMGVPAEKIHVIPYGVRLEDFYPVGEPPPGAFHVLFAGGVSLRKGFPYLLKAFAQVRHPSKKLHVAGHISAEMRPLLAQLPTDDVEFYGSVPQARLRELMSASHALVLPSVEEGFGLVIGQAMACGCPVILSENVGGSDLIEPGVQGFLFPPRDVAALCEHMQHLADDPLQQQAMRQAALDRVQSLGGWQAYGDRWEALLRSLTGAV